MLAYTYRLAYIFRVVMQLDFAELLGLMTAIGAFISMVGGGIWWLVKIAISKGTQQAENLSSQLTYIGENIHAKIDLNDKASRDRHEETNRRLSEHNKAISTQIQDLKDQQNRQLDFIKTVDGKALENTKTVSKVSNRVSILEGRLSNG